MNTIKLSIIIPVFNNPQGLKSCLRSISKQTLVNQLEVIIVDDGSDEHIAVPFFKELSDRVTYIKKEHAGASAARNLGYSKSTGKYLFFCDSDVTFLKKNALEQMLTALEKNINKAYCYSGFLYGIKAMTSFDFNEQKLKQMNYISTMSLVRRSAIEKIGQPFYESLKKFQDWDLWLSLLEVGETGIRINKILWKAKAGGIMSSWLPSFAYKLPFLKKKQKYDKYKEIILKKHNIN